MDANAMIYTHTQVGAGSLAATALGIVFLLLVAYFLRTTGRFDEWPRTRIAGGFTIATMLLVGFGLAFSRMTVAVEDGTLSWSFAFGFLRHRVALSEIASVSVVQTMPEDGWGIHGTPRGTLYSVAGLQAVHVTLRDNTRFQLGTDQPEQLRQAIVGAARTDSQAAVDR